MSVSWRIVQGDCREVLASLDAGSVQCCLTSPPYLGLRDYGLPATAWPAVTYRTLGGEVRVPAMECVLGLEPSVEAWVGHLVQVFREVRRVLRDDGTLWLNLGDAWNNRRATRPSSHQGGLGFTNESIERSWAEQTERGLTQLSRREGGLKEKDLMGLPWQVAFALRADGWWLREEVVWSKSTAMPESVRDRCTRSHEQLFRLTKSRRYFADMDAIAEPAVSGHPSGNGYARPESLSRRNADGTPRGQEAPWADIGGTRNKRSVWPAGDALDVWARLMENADDALRPTIEAEYERWLAEQGERLSVWPLSSAPFPATHFATFPPKLVEPAILCATSPTACGECGAPWRRVVDVARGQPDEQKRALTDAAYRDPRAAQSINTTGAHGSGVRARSTVGFEPTCCHHDDTGRCTVLDPFAGAATTGLVALRHDRSFVGIELNAEYVEMGRARILADQPLLNQATEAS